MATANLPAQAESINRRSVLKSTGALIGAAAIGFAGQATASEHNPDAKLLALWSVWKVANTQARETSDKSSDASTAACDAYPTVPDCLHSAKIGWERGLRYAPIKEIELHYSPSVFDMDEVAAKAEQRKRVRAFVDWQSKCNAIDEWHDVHSFWQIEQEAWGVLQKIEDNILATPARTASGLFVKLSIWHRSCGQDAKEDWPGHFAISALEDVKRLIPSRSGIIGHQ